MQNKFDSEIYKNHKYDPLKKIRIAISGFWFIFSRDFSVAYKVIISIVLLIFTFLYRELVDVMIILIATGYMLSMEIMNSCIELLCDFHNTGFNLKIKTIKDVSSVATGISILVWVIVIGYEIFQF